MDHTSEKLPDSVSHYRRLAKQVSLIRWVVPIVLFLIVIGFELPEHLIFEADMHNAAFFLEILIFGIAGPLLVAIVLSWIVHNLNHLAAAYEQIEAFNVDLERRIQVRTDELAQANEKLRQLDRLKSDFVSMVSHELRAPLTNIQGGLELVLSSEDLCPPVQNNLTIIQSEVKRLIRLVQRILDVSVIESGQLTLNLGPIALRPLLRQVIEHVALSNKIHPIQLDIPPQAHLATADEERLTDIVTSLLQNAIKYSPDGGEIRVALRFDNDFAYISVKDHGVGISPDDISHLTEKFYRGHLSSHSHGYGLGLYFVNELIKAQGGRLTIESEGIRGKGSTVTFTVPLEKETLYERDPAY
jgi:signal transduction histidine kinase